MDWRIGVIIAALYAAGMIWRAASFFAWRNKHAPGMPINAARLVPDIMFWPYSYFKRWVLYSELKRMTLTTKKEFVKMMQKIINEEEQIIKEEERRNDHV